MADTYYLVSLFRAKKVPKRSSLEQMRDTFLSAIKSAFSESVFNGIFRKSVEDSKGKMSVDQQVAFQARLSGTSIQEHTYEWTPCAVCTNMNPRVLIDKMWKNRKRFGFDDIVISGFQVLEKEHWLEKNWAPGCPIVRNNIDITATMRRWSDG